MIICLGTLLGNLLGSSAIAAEPPAELTSAARDYRIEIYGAFRMNRAEYDARRKQGETLLAEWQTRGAKPEEAAVLVRWFDEARRAASRQQPLPPAPNWNGSVEELIPVPAPLPRLTPRPASPLPLLRALPVKRVRVGRQVAVTAISADIVRPRESHAAMTLLAALPDTPSLGLVLDYPNTTLERASYETELTKSEQLAQANISATQILAPEPKTTVSTNDPVTRPMSATEAAELNTAELRARIRGYDKAWRALQADLYSDEELTLERGDALVTILLDLGQARRDLQLYQAIAPLELREELRQLSPLEELVKRLRELLQAAHEVTTMDLSLAPAVKQKIERAWRGMASQLP